MFLFVPPFPQYPDGDSLSPYVLICEDPIELVVYFPIKVRRERERERGELLSSTTR